jgi:dTMP kinase
MDIQTIKQLNEIATDGFVPDLTVLLDLNPEESLARVSNELSLFDSADQRVPRRADNESERRFEEAPLMFHRNVRHGYLKLSNKDRRWCVVRANQAGHRVADAILKRVRRLLIEHGVPSSVFQG